MSTYPPSKEKLQALREQGIFPFSFDALSFALFAGCCLGSYLAFQSSELERFLELVRKIFAGRSSTLLVFKALGQSFFKLSVLLLFPIITSLLFSYFLQTRVLCSFAFFKLDFARLFLGFSKFFLNFKKRVWSFVFGFIKVFLLLFLLYCFLRDFFEKELLEMRIESFIQLELKFFVSYLKHFILLFFVSAGIFALFSLVLTKFYFALEHQVSKKEANQNLSRD